MRFVKYAALTLLFAFVFCVAAGAEEAPQEELYRAESDYYCALRGDIDGDGKVTAADARRILRCAVKLDVVDYSRQNAYNLDGVLAITSTDARTALRVAVGLEARPAHEDAGSIILQQATCAESGITAHQCKYCRDLYHFGVIPQQEHTGGGWVTVTKATCSEKGKKEQYCIYCGMRIDTQTVPTTPHVYGDVQYVDANPDCTKNQFVYEECIYCGHREDRLRPATPHTYEWVTVLEPTCTTQGSRLERCSVCGRDRLDGQIEILPTLGHQPSGWIVVQRASYCGDGLRRITCQRCGEILEEETITAVGSHTWAWVTDAAPTCVSAGEKHEECPVCHAKRNEGTEIPATGIHLYTAQTVTEDALKTGATCTNPAVYYYSCAVCGAVESDDTHTFTEGETLPHTWEWTTVTEPTCTDFGKETERCAVCGAEREDGEERAIDPLGHLPGEERVVSEPTSENEGLKIVVCRRCGVTLEEIVIPKLEP